jgi:hypothetical protein
VWSVVVFRLGERLDTNETALRPRTLYIHHSVACKQKPLVCFRFKHFPHAYCNKPHAASAAAGRKRVKQ